MARLPRLYKKDAAPPVRIRFRKRHDPDPLGDRENRFSLRRRDSIGERVELLPQNQVL